jgi:hypothetical protein
MAAYQLREGGVGEEEVGVFMALFMRQGRAWRGAQRPGDVLLHLDVEPFTCQQRLRAAAAAAGNAAASAQQQQQQQQRVAMAMAAAAEPEPPVPLLRSLDNFLFELLVRECALPARVREVLVLPWEVALSPAEVLRRVARAAHAGRSRAAAAAAAATAAAAAAAATTAGSAQQQPQHGDERLQRVRFEWGVPPADAWVPSAAERGWPEAGAAPTVLYDSAAAVSAACRILPPLLPLEEGAAAEAAAGAEAAAAAAAAAASEAEGGDGAAAAAAGASGERPANGAGAAAEMAQEPPPPEQQQQQQQQQRRVRRRLTATTRTTVWIDSRMWLGKSNEFNRVCMRHLARYDHLVFFAEAGSEAGAVVSTWLSPAGLCGDS